MAVLTATTPTNTGTVTAGAAVSASDTVSVSVMGSQGAYLYVANAGGSTDNITISDNGLTPAGNSLSQAASSTGNKIGDALSTGTAQIYVLRPQQADPTTNLITITHSFTTSVTYQLWPVGGV